ncbi:hypothetical protein M422DRAFT_265686 [Sphaerobolus stellatus SS14]|uniref:Glutathione transferase n=1 Tax=Sphaerobolus stellatus (strain SS14) TaxID=990650 RepID=A0A0C9UTF6_SPHS4|nr:hypothetical protein M422DRAFT_265686 [Sphaerobolus stellatus SS14]
MAPQVTLFSNTGVPNPAKIAIFLEELNIEYEVIHRSLGKGGPDGAQSAQYLELNPMGKVPAIVDHTNNDFSVWESAAILLYLAERFSPDGKYSGKTLEERAVVSQWLLFDASQLTPNIYELHVYKRWHPVKDLDPSINEHYKTEIYDLWSMLEHRLERQDWMALDRMTIVDIALIPWLMLSNFLRLDLKKHPNIATYIGRLEALPSVKRAYNHHFNELAQSSMEAADRKRDLIRDNRWESTIQNTSILRKNGFEFDYNMHRTHVRVDELLKICPNARVGG